LDQALLALKKANAKLSAAEREKSEPIAIVGLSCRFPGGANDAESFWRLLETGTDAVREIPPERWPRDPAFPEPPSSWAGLLDAVDGFDAPFFGISPREAARLDPQQRLLLEVSWEALESAGYAPSSLGGSRTGVYVGICSLDYQRQLLGQDPADVDAHVVTGNMVSVAAGRLSYVLGLQGPCMSLDTACSSSLVSVHLACQSLRSRESDMALAGGVNLILSPASMFLLARTQALSPDGRCKAFDARANGYARGEGCGMLVLKRLSDAERDGDPIWAVIRGSAINQDGRSTGMTAPNVLSQQALLRKALENARVKPEQIGYVEAHGTGTSLGDPIEMEALKSVLGQPRADGSACTIGSVKSNIGHLEAAAGVAGLIKVVLSFQHQAIPRHLHFQTLNPRISLDGTPFRIASSALPWKAGTSPRFAGVSSFGMSGTNAHIILEEPPRAQAPQTVFSLERKHHVVTLSAMSDEALRKQATRLSARLAAPRGEFLGDIGFTTRVGRAHFTQRAAFVAERPEELREQLQAWLTDGGAGVTGSLPVVSRRPKVAFLFTGQGSQYAGMGRGLYETEPVFREALDRCAALLKGELPLPLLDVMWGAHSAELDQTRYTQPALFALEYALCELWRSWGVEPDVVIGHSVGEYAAACAAGVMSLEDAARLIAVRARMMQSLEAAGAMLAVQAEPSRVEPLVARLGPDISIAAFNGPQSLVLSGRRALVEEAARVLAAEGVKVKPLNVSHAFHSALMEPMLDAFEREAARVMFRAPGLAWVTNLTGARADAGFGGAAYWRRQIREPVRFVDGVRAASEQGCELWIEIGPNPVLLGSIPAIAGDAAVSIPSLRKGQEEGHVLMQAVARLYTRGVKLDWQAFDKPFARRRVVLPTYPFDRERHWMRAAPLPGARVARSNSAHPLLGERLLVPGREVHFSNTLAPEFPSYLGEHRIFGEVVVPAAFYVSAFLAAAEQAAGARGLEDVLFARALTVNTEQRVDIVVAPREGGGARIEMASAGGDETSPRWTAHASAVASDGPVAEVSGSVGLEALRARCAQEAVPSEALAGVWGAPGQGEVPSMSLGPSFRWISSLWRGPSEALARLERPASLAAEGGVHPTLLDSCFQLMGASLSGAEMGNAYMPISIERVRVLGPVEGTLWCHASTGVLAGGALVRGDVQVLDESGRKVLELTGARLKRVAREDLLLLREAWSEWLYEVKWHAREFPPAPAGGLSESAPWVICLDQRGLGERLAAEVQRRGGRAVRIVSGNEWRQVAPDHYEVVPGNAEELRRALVHALGEEPSAAYVVSLSALDEGGPAEVSARALATAQALSRLRWKRAPRLWWLTEGAQAVGSGNHALSIEQAGVWGLGRNVAAELNELWGGVLDLEPEGRPEQVLRLLDLVSGEEDQLALRGDSVFAARLERYRPARASQRVPLREDATYVISGGLGGIGWRLARAWMEQGARSLVLLGRSAPSEALRAELAGYEQRGIRVRTVQVDVSDREALARAWKGLEETLPPIAGVAHAAGVLSDAALPLQSEEHLRTAFAPKVLGALNLHGLTEGKPLDFFILFSSLAAVVGSPGQANYAAANACLDALAHERRRLGLPAVSLDWGPWAEVGMAVAHQRALSARGLTPLPPEAALEALAGCLQEERARLIVAAVDWPAVSARLPARGRSLLAAWAPKEKPASMEESGQFVRKLLAAPARQRRDLLLTHLTSEVRRVLGLARGTRIEPGQSFFEMGFDSLMAVELRTALQQALGKNLPASLAFEYPNLDALTTAMLAEIGPGAEAEPAVAPALELVAPPPKRVEALADDEAMRAVLEGKVPAAALPPVQLASLATQVRANRRELPLLAAEPIAIVGMGCRFPGGARDPERFWRLLRDGIEGVRDVPAERWDKDAWYDPDPEAPGKMRTRRGGFLEGAAEFDAAFFGISPREAKCMDPQHRLLLEVAWEALEDAGQPPPRLMGSKTGVFMGFLNNDYLGAGDLAELEGHFATGNGFSNAVGRLSYVLGLHGPSVALDTACSSSLVAIHLASQSLRQRECDMALAGGVNLILAPGLSVMMSKLGALAPDGRCKTFDASADGYVRGDGCGVLVLKRLSDALRDRDRIVAVVRGSAVNHGGRGGGFSQPNVHAQQMLLREALATSQTLPGQVSYLEAHGTGTPLGDPIEVRAATAVLSSGRTAESPLMIGSVKTNLGHLEAAAGVAGVMKVALALQHREIPPHLNFQELSPHIDLSAIPAQVPTRLTPWQPVQGRRIAGVSAFGLAGTNAHVILEEAPGLEEVAVQVPEEARDELLVLSARSEQALAALADSYVEHLRTTGTPLRDVAGTAGARRAHHEYRLAVVGGTAVEAVEGLEAFRRGASHPGVVAGASEAGSRPRLVFVFPGQGSQWLGMGRELYAREPVFRRALDQCDEAMRAHTDWRLLDALQASEAPQRIDVVQPLLFAMSVGLGALWRSWGLEPDAVVGHSMGEVAAAYVAGALSLEDAARVICVRSRLMREVAGRGAMAVVELSAGELREWLAPYGGALSLAVCNSPRSSVMAGDAQALESLLAKLEGARVFCRRVKVDVASHSAQVDPLREPLLRALEGIQPRAGTVPLWSTVTGEVTDGSDLGPEYWVRNLREPVQFAQVVQALMEADHRLFLELSPHPILVPPIEQTVEHGAAGQAWAVGSLQREKPERTAMLRALGTLYARGYPVDFRHLYPGSRCVPLPTYPFQRQRYWLDVAPSASGRKSASASVLGERLPDLAHLPGQRVWQVALDERLPALFRADADSGWTVGLPTVLKLVEAAAREVLGTGLRRARVGMEAPVSVGSGVAGTLQTVFTQEAERRELRFFHRASEEGPWKVLARASLDTRPAEDEGAWSLEIARQRCPEERPGAREIDPALVQVWSGVGGLLARVRADEAAQFPRALARLLEPLGAASRGPGGAWLPLNVEHWNLHLPLASESWLHVAPHPLEGDALTVDVGVFQPDGGLAMELRGLSFRRVASGPGTEARGDALASLLYELAWPEVAASQARREAGSDRFLVLADRGGFGEKLARELESRGHSCAVVRASEAGLEQGMLGVLQGGASFRACIHLGSLDFAPGSGGAPPAGAATLLDSVLRTLAVLARRGSPPLWLVTRGAQHVGMGEISLSQAPVWGLGRTIAVEHPALWGGLIDLEPSGADGDVALLADALTQPDGERQIAFRDSRRRVARLTAAPIGADSPPPDIRGDRTYWITSGLSGLGGDAAAWLVERGARHLLVSGAPGVDSAGRLRALEAGGVSVTFDATPLHDGSALARVLDRLGVPLAGILHTLPPAVAPAPLTQTAPEALVTAFREAALGAWGLHEATRGRELDFLLLCSPAISLLGGAGQGPVAAASQFLEGLAALRRDEALPTTSILLAAWPGEAAESLGKLGVTPLTAEQLLDVSGRALSSGFTHRMAASIDWSAFRPVYEARGDRQLLERVGMEEAAASGGAAEWRKQLSELPPEAARKRVAETVVAYVTEVLGLPADQPLGMSRRFADLGMDSVMAVRLMTKLSRTIGERLPTVLAFEHPTATALANHISENVLRLREEERVERAGEDDDQSEDELAALLAEKLRKLG
jgi:acyl transferase domain-containing protein/acyl carrier protein